MSLSLNAFFPTLAATLGYNRTVTLLLCAPPWIFAILVALAVARLVFYLLREKLRTHVEPQTFRRHRGEILPHDLLLVRWAGWICDCVFYHEHRCAIHFSVSDSNPLPFAKDLTLHPLRFLMAQSYAALVVYWAWICSTFPRPPSKRAVAIALINGSGAMGNIAGSYFWPKPWGESYRYSFAICIAVNGLSIVMILGFRAYLKALNEKAEREEQAQGLPTGYRYSL